MNVKCEKMRGRIESFIGNLVKIDDCLNVFAHQFVHCSKIQTWGVKECFRL